MIHPYRTVTKAVVPAAGLGSRMLPMTKSVPKEMFPAGTKPMIHLVVEEAQASGIFQICIVLRPGKEIIKDYFSLRHPGEGEGNEGAEAIEELVKACEIRYVYQPEPRGLGDALLQCRDFVGSDAFVMMIPDQLIISREPATKQILEHWYPGIAIWSALINLPSEEARYFPGARGYALGEEISPAVHRVEALISADEMDTRLNDVKHQIRGIGRTVYPPQIFDYLGPDHVNPRTGQVDLLKTFEVCSRSIDHYAVFLNGDFFDLGTFEGYYRYAPRIWELFRQ
jgi:UTP--glucose-1-phosphate uridylyltransferase